jgi:hypothetical protein
MGTISWIQDQKAAPASERLLLAAADLRLSASSDLRLAASSDLRLPAAGNRLKVN